MNWDKLYQLQNELDTYIETNQGIKKQDVFEKKYLALLVELGELANETRCFKFWSNKPRSERETILEEYVDGVHFLLSLGITKGHYFSGNVSRNKMEDETKLFLNVYTACHQFFQHPTSVNYDHLWETYLHLGQALGFSEEDVHRAYLEKNEVNFVRQDEGY
ncbi:MULTISPECIES: dUTP diphosphatase [Virgibacillus]|uniref:dUTP diphosphatase n=1 Tax=Virgibacillus dokdonensis TaxID=302167 RepID=A0ABU7VEI3_9BACI|nr:MULTISPECIES: dUTP diphosphatase [Virgibacillus]NWO13651.1 dUTP diphosphatase [Virgibacillus sp.]